APAGRGRPLGGRGGRRGGGGGGRRGGRGGGRRGWVGGGRRGRIGRRLILVNRLERDGSAGQWLGERHLIRLKVAECRPRREVDRDHLERAVGELHRDALQLRRGGHRENRRERGGDDCGHSRKAQQSGHAMSGPRGDESTLHANRRDRPSRRCKSLPTRRSRQPSTLLLQQRRSPRRHSWVATQVGTGGHEPQPYLVNLKFALWIVPSASE